MEALIIEKLMLSVPFIPYVGIEITEAKTDKGCGYLEQRQDIENHMATMHAGALYTLAESVAGAIVTAIFLPKISTLKIVASAAKVEYLKVAKGKIRATSSLLLSSNEIIAELDSVGKASFSINVDMIDNGNISVAAIMFEFHVADTER